MALKDLLDQRAEIGKEIRRLADLANDSEREWTPQDEEAWTRCNGDFDALGTRIEREQRAQEVDRLLDEAPRKTLLPDMSATRRQIREAEEEREEQERQEDLADSDRQETPRERRLRQISDSDRILTLQAWLRAGTEELPLEPEHIAACKRAGVNPYSKGFDIPLYRTGEFNRKRAEFRAQSTSATAGGEFIPEGFVNNLERAMLWFGGILQVADILRTNSGNPLPWPTVNDTGQTGALLAENTQVAEQDVVTSEMVLNAYKFTSKLVRVSTELLEDSAFDLSSTLADILGERLGRVINTFGTTGTGTAQPKGIVTAATVGITAAGGTAITGDELKNLVHSVDIAYRSQPGAGFMMRDSTLLYVRKLKDGQGNYLWDNNYQAGDPDRLLGYPVSVNNDVAAIALSAKTVVFGALRKLKVRMVNNIRLLRLVERYADFDQTGFVAFVRMDSDLLNAGTNPVKVLQQAAV